MRIGKEQAKTPLWKKLFFPAHIKIPLEAAAVVLVFLLAYGVQKEMPSSKAPPPPASVGSGKAEPATGTRENRQKAGAPARPPAEGSDRETRKKETRRQTAAAMPEEKNPADDFAPRLETSAGPTKTELPSVPATRVSTGGGAIGTAFPGTSQAEEAFGPRVFAHPESRLLRPSPFEKEVTIEVPPGDRAGRSAGRSRSCRGDSEPGRRLLFARSSGSFFRSIAPAYFSRNWGNWGRFLRRRRPDPAICPPARRPTPSPTPCASASDELPGVPVTPDPRFTPSPWRNRTASCTSGTGRT